MNRIRLVVLVLGTFLLPSSALAQEEGGGLEKAWNDLLAARRDLSGASGALREPAQEAYERALSTYWRVKKETLASVFSRHLSGQGTSPELEEEPTPSPKEEASIDLAEIQRVVVGLFESYEREDVQGFLEHVHSEFSARDETGNDYRYADLPRALSDDFEVLDRIEFTVHVGQITVQEDAKRAQAEVRWSRRAWIQTDGVEWIVLDQRSVFQFDRSPNPGSWLLSRIFGDPIFGLSNRRGQIVTNEGTLDESPIEETVTLDRFEGVIRPQSAPAPVEEFNEPIEGTFTIDSNKGFLDFDTQTLVSGCGATPVGSDINFRCVANDRFAPVNRATVKDITSQFSSLDSIQELPPPPYGGQAQTLQLGVGDVGRLFAVQSNTGFFAGFQITSYDVSADTYVLRYKYQPDGSRKLSKP